MIQHDTKFIVGGNAKSVGDDIVFTAHVLVGRDASLRPRLNDEYELFIETWRRPRGDTNPVGPAPGQLVSRKPTGRWFIVTDVRPDHQKMRPIRGQMQVWHVKSESCVRLKKL
jgi:hypothetical protein